MISHEELSQSPVATFKQLYGSLDLPWSTAIEQSIVKQTKGNESAEAKRNKVQDFNRK